MSVLLLLAMPLPLLAAPPQSAQRTELVVIGPTVSSVAASSAAQDPAVHRLLHPLGPKPVAWDGDWPERDMDLTLLANPAEPRLPPALTVRLCWCDELFHSATALPGVGVTQALEDGEHDD